jgi:hypothetical protein
VFGIPLAMQPNVPGRALRLHLLALGLGAALLTRSTLAEVTPPLVGAERPVARVWLDAGWDPTFVGSTGISSRVLRFGRSTSLDLDAVIAAPLILIPDGRAFRVASGATGSVTPRDGGFGVSLGLHPDLRSSSDSVANMIALGVTAGARPGYYAVRWTAALDLAWSAAALTHIAPRAKVYDLFRDRYPDQDAQGPAAQLHTWTSHRFRLGVTGGFVLRRWLSVHSEAGFAWTPQLTGLVNPPYGPLPFYAALGGAYRW